jgi:hypothetical protein
MAYTHPTALQGVVEEVDRTASESDRQFFQDHPRRSHRLRPAMSAEVSEHEVATGEILPCSPGMQTFTAVKQIQPGIRARLLFIAPAVVAWVDPPEHLCRAWYEFLRNPQFEEHERALAALNLTGAGGQS